MGQTFHQVSYTWQITDLCYTKHHERIVSSYRSEITTYQKKEPADEQATTMSINKKTQVHLQISLNKKNHLSQ